MCYAIRALSLLWFCSYPVLLFSNVAATPVVIHEADADTSVFKDLSPAEQSEYALVLLSILLLLCIVYYIKNNKLSKDIDSWNKDINQEQRAIVGFKEKQTAQSATIATQKTTVQGIQLKLNSIK